MDAVSSSLERRQIDTPRGLRLFVIASVTGHVLLVVTALLAPVLFGPDEKPPLRYVEVVSIPAAALEPGPRPTPKTAPAPEPEPERPPPDPEPEPPPREPPPEAPILPEKEPEPEPEPELQEPPAHASESLAEESTDAAPGPESSPGVSSGRSRDADFVGFDDPEFSVRYSYYLQQLLSAIKRGWTRPQVPEGVELVVSFRIQRQSRAITDLQVVTASGSRPFDRAGVVAVQNARIPPLPQAYRKDSIGVQVIFR